MWSAAVWDCRSCQIQNFRRIRSATKPARISSTGREGRLAFSDAGACDETSPVNQTELPAQAGKRASRVSPSFGTDELTTALVVNSDY